MDFHALPRRDLQALCKRNGVRANMTNAAMADALGALPTVDGIEEYVKQPVAVPAPAVKTVVAEEEVRREKQGSPLPRGRRVTAKTSEVVEADEIKGKEEEKAEDAPPLGAVRRGAGRRARPAPAAAASVDETVEEEEKKLEKPLPRARRGTLKSSEPTKQNGSDEDDKMEANHESNKEEEEAPAVGVGRRGASRRARPAPAAAVATAAAEPAVKTAAVEDKQGIPHPRARRGTVKSSQPDKVVDEEEETENLKQDANKEDAPAQGGVRRGPSRRARPAPVVSKPAAKNAVVEELGSPLPRGRRATVNVKSSAPNHTEDVPLLGVGRRNISRSAQPEPAVSAPVGEVAAVAAEPEDGEEEDKDDPKLEEKEEDLTAHGVVPVEAPATRRRAATSTTEEQNVTLETVPIRPSRQRRPTMKAAAAEEMVPQRAIKKAAPRNSALQQEKEQQEPLGAISDVVFVPSPTCDKGCDDAENVVRNKVIGEPKQKDKEVAINEDEVLMEQNVTLEIVPVRPTRSRRPTMKAAAVEEKVPQRATMKAAARNSTLQQKGQEELLEAGAISDAVFVPTLASDKGCDDAENVEKTADHQNKVQNGVLDEPKQDDSEEVVMNGEEMLMEENLTEAAPVTDQKCADKSPLQEQQVDVKHCATPLLSKDDSSILGLVSSAAEHAVDEDVAGTSDVLLEKDTDKEIHGAGEEIELVPVIQALRASVALDESIEKIDFTGHAAHSEMKSSNEMLNGTDEINEVSSEDGLICQKKGDVVDCEVLPEPIDETTALDCSGYISRVAEEEEAVETMVSQLTVNEAAIDDIVSPVTVMDGKVVEMEKAEELVTEEGPEEKVSPTDFVCVHEQMEAVSLEKAEKFSEKQPQNTATMDEDIEENDLQTDFLHADELKEVFDMEKVEMVTEEAVETMVSQSTENEAVIDDIMPPVRVMDSNVVAMDKAEELVTEEGTEGKKSQTDFVCVHEQMEVVSLEKAKKLSEKQPQNMATMDEDIEESDFLHVDELKVVVDLKKVEMVTDSLPKRTAIVDEDVKEVDVQTDYVHVDTADNTPEVTTIDEKLVEQEKVLSTQETQQSTDTVVVNALDDQLETHFVHSDKVPELIGTDGEVDEENKALSITEEMPESIGSMDERVKESYFEIGFVHADELKKVVTADSLFEVTETEDDDVRNESAFTGDLPQDLDIARDASDNKTPLLDDVIKPLPEITIHEPTVSQDKDILMCKNSGENLAELLCNDSSDSITDEPLCMMKSEGNTAEPVAMEENMGLNVAKKSADLSKLSLGQLKAKLKKKLKRNEEKRVALSRVDENVCRSNATGQEQVRKLQQY